MYLKKYKRAGIIFAFFILLIALAPKIMTEMGEFLLVDEIHSEKLPALTPALSEKISESFHKGEISKIYVFVGNHEHSWKALRNFDFNNWVNKRADLFNIDRNAIQVVKSGLDFSPNEINNLLNFLTKNNIDSARLYVPYYQTRAFRFYMDRAFDGGEEDLLYVQPLNKNPEKNFQKWWLNTALDNLFLDQYLKIFWYYFNVALGESAFEGGS